MRCVKKVSILLKGIDVSKYNGKIDWQKVKKSGKVDFVMLRCGFGKENSKQIDSTFEYNYTEAKKTGIPVGVYHYSYAMTIEDALKEAEFCYKLIKDKKLEMPVFYDIEEKSQLALGKDIVQGIAKTFCTYMESRGIWVGVYSMDSAFGSHLDSVIQNRYACWVAKVENVKPKLCKQYGIWQYSWKGKIDGTNGEVDMNYCYVDYPTMIKKGCKNGFTKTDLSDSSATDKVVTAKTYQVPTGITFKTDVNKNVITNYSYKKSANVKLSDHFQIKEFASMSGNKLYSNTVKVHNKLIIILEALFKELDCSKIIVNSGYRTAEHDKAVGGNGTGQHTLGRAADVVCYGKDGKIISAKKVCCTLEDMGGIYGIGYISENATHIDTRTKASKWWGDETKSGSPNITKLGYNSFHKYFNM